MKVGIIGYWYATNYGSACTYYALYKQIEKLGHTPIIIDMPEREAEPNWDKSFARKFITDHCMVSESVKWNETAKLNALCDVFVVGSDQVWNRDGYRISHGLFFLNFADKTKHRIAYAPSFGSDDLSSLDVSAENDMGDLLSKFDAISVREKSGAELIKNKFGIDSEFVIDPVFFLKEQDYDALSAKIDLPSEYVLAYILDPIDDKELFLSKIQKKYDLPVVVLLDGRYGTFDKNKAKLHLFKNDVISIDGVPEWLYCFKHAKAVVTDSFHGTSLSLINSKQTYVYANHGRGYQRFVSLLSSLDLTRILFENSEELSLNPDIDIDFESIHQKIQSIVGASEQWLEQSLVSTRPHNCIAYQMNLKLKCSGCSACFSSCPSDAISMQLNKDGFINPVIDENKCSDCGICSNVCKVLNPEYTNDPNPECYAVCASDDIREVSSSGGVFTILADQILDSGGHVYGASYDADFDVEHICIDSKGELDLLRGSKYIQSRMNAVYPKVKADLECGIAVLFSGMPCQVAGLKSYLGKDYSNLLTVDLLCHGIASFDVFEKYHKDVLEGKKLKSLQFKSKKPWGWHAGVNATFYDDSKYSCIFETDPYFVAYIKGLSKNKACGICPFNKLPRQGDITIGDFWKIQDYKPSLNDNKGTSLILINNIKGKKEFDLINKNFPVCEKAPIDIAISGNGCIKYPYRLHPQRDYFFNSYMSEDFGELVKSITSPKYPLAMPKDRPYRLRSVYSQAKVVYDNYKGREVVVWGDNSVFRSILKKYFGIDVKHIISSQPSSDPRFKSPEYIVQNSKNIYVACFGKSSSFDSERFFEENGLKYIRDYNYRSIHPIVLDDLDLSKGYADSFGNKILGYRGIVKKITLRGYNNTIIFKNNVHGCENLIIDITSNSRIVIGDGVLFTQPCCEFNVQGYEGDAAITIGAHCRFMRSLIRLFVDLNTSAVHIGENTTFGDNLRIHANSGKRVVIGKNSMISRDVVFWSGDGHSIFDVTTGTNINSIYSKQPSYRNTIVLGEHVWVGDGAMLLHGTDIGEGSIVGAKSVAKLRCANNVSLAGNPAGVIKENVAWAHEMCAEDMARCGPYAKMTSSCLSPLYGKDVLVIGGSQNNGKSLIKELLDKGNVVTIANRGNKDDGFGDRVSRLTLDVTSFESIKLALSGKKFDVVFNDVAYSSISVRNVLSLVKCRHYVQLSSVFVYDFHENMKESDFDIQSKEVVWSKATGDYAYNKRISEIATKEFPDVHTVIVRIPYVYYTDRLDYFCDHIIEEKPMNVPDPDRKLTFVSNWDLSKFLVWISNQDYSGVVNFSSDGYTTVRNIIEHIEAKAGKKAVLDSNSGEPVPFSDKSFTLDLSRVKELGYGPETLDSWLWRVIDGHVDRLKKEKLN